MERRKAMSFPTPMKEAEILGELLSLAQLLGLEVIESSNFPTVRVRVACGDKKSTITKQGSDFLATDSLPDVPMTFIGGGMFAYRVDV
jgi:hypothetical protein